MKSFGRRRGDDFRGGVAFAFALVPRSERAEHHAVVGGVAGEAETADREGAEEVFVLIQDRADFRFNVGGVGQRSALRRLDQDHEEALVFLRHEGGGDVVVFPVRAEEADKEEQRA